MKRITRAQRDECIRIRVTEQLSTPAIAKRVGIGNQSAYKILAKFPWEPLWTPPKGGKRLTWSRAEVATLIRLWKTADEADLLAALPQRKWPNIGRKAASLRLRRPQPGSRQNKRYIHPLFVQLRDERVARGWTRPQLAARCGYHHNQLLSWELGKAWPKLQFVTEWAKALGFDLALTKQQGIAPVDRSAMMGGRAPVTRRTQPPAPA